MHVQARSHVTVAWVMAQEAPLGPSRGRNTDCTGSNRCPTHLPFAAFHTTPARIYNYTPRRYEEPAPRPTAQYPIRCWRVRSRMGRRHARSRAAFCHATRPVPARCRETVVTSDYAPPGYGATWYHSASPLNTGPYILPPCKHFIGH